MDIDLKGKAPKVQTLEEAKKVIKALWDIVRQKDENKNTNSKNSSLPPSKDNSSKNKSNVRRTEQRRKNPKNLAANQDIQNTSAAYCLQQKLMKS